MFTFDVKNQSTVYVYIFLGINHTNVTHEHTSVLLFLIHHRGVHWVLVQYAQMDFVLQYLKLIQFLVMCHFYWTLATRALRRERLTNWWVSLSLSLSSPLSLSLSLSLSDMSLSFSPFSFFHTDRSLSSLAILMYTVQRVIFAPCNFRTLTLTKCFVLSQICPDKVLFLGK